MPTQLPLFANLQVATSTSVSAPMPLTLSVQIAWPPANWQDVSDVGVEVGLPLAYAEKDLLEALPDPDGARLWDVLWTTHYYLEVLHENNVRFTLTWDIKDYRFAAVHLLPVGILVRLDPVQPETKT
jgi:hypothetical protein